MARRANKGGLRPPRGLGGAEPPGSEWNAAQRVVGAATERRRELARCRAPPKRRSGATTPHAGTAQAFLRGASARRAGHPRHWGACTARSVGGWLVEERFGGGSGKGGVARATNPRLAPRARGCSQRSGAAFPSRVAGRPSDASARQEGRQRGQRLPQRAVQGGVLHWKPSAWRREGLAGRTG